MARRWKKSFVIFKSAAALFFALIINFSYGNEMFFIVTESSFVHRCKFVGSILAVRWFSMME